MKSKILKSFGFFENQKVGGTKFMLGDSLWLLLDEKSSKKLKKEAVLAEKIENLKDRWVNIKIKPVLPEYNSQGYDISKFVRL